MPKFININSSHIVAGRKVHFKKDDVINISFQKEVSGFGLHFSPIAENQAFNLRSINSSVGLDTYAPSQRFRLDKIRLRIVSRGDETIEVSPYRSGKRLSMRAKYDGYLTHDSTKIRSYKPPQWAYDYWFSTSWTRMNQHTVLKEIDTAHRHHLEPRIWLLDAGWASTKTYLDFDLNKFPEGNNFLKVMHQSGVKPILWISPFIDSGTKLWETFDKNNWLVKNISKESAEFTITGDNESIGSYIDFTSKSFIEFLTQKIKDLHTIGLSGLMFDFGESLPDESILCLETESSKAASSLGLVGHNWYVGEIKKILHAIAAPLDMCLISRSGWTESFTDTGLWLGDQSSDVSRFAGLESVLWGYKTAYDAGYRFIGMDAGGYFGNPSINDYKKWLDLSVCMPFTMLHGAIQANPWELGGDILSHFRKVREHHARIWSEPNGVEAEFELSANKQKIISVKVKDCHFTNQSSKLNN